MALVLWNDQALAPRPGELHIIDGTLPAFVCQPRFKQVGEGEDERAAPGSSYLLWEFIFDPRHILVVGMCHDYDLVADMAIPIQGDTVIVR